MSNQPDKNFPVDDDDMALWQLPVFENGDSAFRRPDKLAKNRDNQSPPEETEAKLPTVEEITAIQNAAHEEGCKLGYQEGMAQAQQEVAQWELSLKKVLESLVNPLEQQQQVVSEELADLAMSVTRHIIRREVQQDPAQVIAVVREAINLLPSTQGDIVVRLHPEDANLIRKIFSLNDQQQSSWSITDDPSVSRGGCMVSSNASKVDATLEKRISTIFAHIFGDQRDISDIAPEQAASDEVANSDTVQEVRSNNVSAEVVSAEKVNSSIVSSSEVSSPSDSINPSSPAASPTQPAEPLLSQPSEQLENTARPIPPKLDNE